MNTSIKIAWWNTSLSPARVKSRSTPAALNFVTDIIKKLINDEGMDIIGLCEVSSSDVNHINTFLQGTNYSTVDATNAIKGARTRFDLCVIYNNQKLSIKTDKSISTLSPIRTMKIGHLVHFIMQNSSTTNSSTDEFCIILSHWPSITTCSTDSALRISHAQNLFELVQNTQKSSPYIILMGDYNDEPFSKSMEEHLRATRDIENAISDDTFLYNTSWRHTGSHTSCINLNCNTPHLNTGTIYYRGDFTNWRVYDQIIVSHAIIKGGGWSLSNKASYIYNDNAVSTALRDKSKIFDHLPIWAEIYR